MRVRWQRSASGAPPLYSRYCFTERSRAQASRWETLCNGCPVWKGASDSQCSVTRLAQRWLQEEGRPAPFSACRLCAVGVACPKMASRSSSLAAVAGAVVAAAVPTWEELRGGMRRRAAGGSISSQ